MTWTIQDAMDFADHIAMASRCNSVKRGCVLLSEDGMMVEYGYNDTVTPTCLAGICHKRKLGEGHGESIFCRAMHAETMAAGKAMAKGETRVHTAVCNFPEMPCTMCLANLHKAVIKKIVLLNDCKFYTYNDEIMWDHQYKGLMEVEVWYPPKALEADKQ